MTLDHVFARATVTVVVGGAPVLVAGGTHWLADDPLVLARPDLFTADCRYGLAWSGSGPPECLLVPPGDEGPGAADEESGAVMTSRVRARSQAERSRAAR